jgi:hypothetical protein
MRSFIKIDCFLSLSCAAEDDLRTNIFGALALEKVKAEVNFNRIDEREADRLGLRGSPSVLINEEDIQPIEAAGFS